MQGIQPRSLTNRELIRHCANTLELTTNALPYEFQMELLRRLNLLACANEGAHPDSIYPAPIDPEAD